MQTTVSGDGIGPRITRTTRITPNPGRWPTEDTENTEGENEEGDHRQGFARDHLHSAAHESHDRGATEPISAAEVGGFEEGIVFQITTQALEFDPAGFEDVGAV